MIGDGVAVAKKQWNPEYSPLSHLTLDSGMAGFDEAAFLCSTGCGDLKALSKGMCEAIILLGPTLGGLLDAVKPAPRGPITGKAHPFLLPTRRALEVEVTVVNHNYPVQRSR